MAENLATLTMKIEALIFDCFQKSIDIILQGRKGILEPSHGTSSQDVAAFRDNAQHSAQALRPWKNDLSAPLVVDICILDPESKRYFLIERWKILYRRKDENKDARINTLNRKISTLMRTLYCFIRLLPGFQLLQLSFSTPILNFRVYNPDQAQQVAVKSFHFDTATYEFPRIQTFRGTLCLGVRHVGPAIIQQILRIPSGIYDIPGQVGTLGTPQSQQQLAAGYQGSSETPDMIYAQQQQQRMLNLASPIRIPGSTASPIPIPGYPHSIPGSKSGTPVKLQQQQSQSPDTPRGKSLPNSSNYDQRQSPQPQSQPTYLTAPSPPPPGDISGGRLTHTQSQGQIIGGPTTSSSISGVSQHPPLQRRPRSSSLNDKALQNQYYSNAGSPYSPNPLLQQQQQQLQQFQQYNNDNRNTSSATGCGSPGIAIPSSGYGGGGPGSAGTGGMGYLPGGGGVIGGVIGGVMQPPQSRSLDSKSPLYDAILERKGQQQQQQSRNNTVPPAVSPHHRSPSLPFVLDQQQRSRSSSVTNIPLLPPPAGTATGAGSSQRGGLSGMFAAAAAGVVGSPRAPPAAYYQGQAGTGPGADDLLFSPEPGTSFPGSVGSGGVKMSPPFLQSSPQLLSTSPLVGNAVVAAYPGYQMRGGGGVVGVGLGGWGGQLGGGQLQQQQQQQQRQHQLSPGVMPDQHQHHHRQQVVGFKMPPPGTTGGQHPYSSEPEFYLNISLPPSPFEILSSGVAAGGAAGGMVPLIGSLESGTSEPNSVSASPAQFERKQLLVRTTSQPASGPPFLTNNSAQQYSPSTIGGGVGVGGGVGGGVSSNIRELRSRSASGDFGAAVGIFPDDIDEGISLARERYSNNNNGTGTGAGTDTTSTMNNNNYQQQQHPQQSSPTPLSGRGGSGGGGGESPRMMTVGSPTVSNRLPPSGAPSSPFLSPTMQGAFGELDFLDHPLDGHHQHHGDGGGDDGDDDQEDEDDDMPFAWAQSEAYPTAALFLDSHRNTTNAANNNNFTNTAGATGATGATGGSSRADEHGNIIVGNSNDVGGSAPGAAGGSTQQQQQQQQLTSAGPHGRTSSKSGLTDYLTAPPPLLGFPDAPWPESNVQAISDAIYRQLQDLKAFRAMLPY